MIGYPENLLSDLSVIIGTIALAVIIWGVFSCLVKWLYSEIFSRMVSDASSRREEARLALGSYILLGLEILIVADIIETVVNPTLEEIAILGAIVLIRTVISVFLDREIREKERIGPPE
jgi:uncharacterized membrane protein